MPLNTSSSDAPITHLLTKTIDVLIIGSGISGLFTALKLSEYNIRSLIVTKNALSENNSRYAQGGIAAVLPENDDDSLSLHVQDTLNVGAGLCVPEAVQAILSQGHLAISDLLLMGVPFDKDELGNIEKTLEAGHSVRRIIHAGGDATGKQVEMTLINKVHADPNIEVIEYCEVAHLFTQDKACDGAHAINYQTQQEYRIFSQHTILATGGLGRLYSQSTNPAGATGNGFSLAYQAGAELRDMEFVQFHPTAFFKDGNAHFLISEALRGEGGVLKNHAGERFAKHYDTRGELAPRDVVTRAIYQEIEKQKQLNPDADHVYLDISHLTPSKIEHRFPTILKACEQFGIDIRKDQIPVAPAAHYVMGGVVVDMNGQTSLQRLHVVGETVWTGLHGGNRLASNSLLECVVLARNCAQAIGTTASPTGLKNTLTEQTEFLMPYKQAPIQFDTPETLTQATQTLHQLMWKQVGIVRNETALRDALEKIQQLDAEAQNADYKQYAPLGIDYVNQLTLARLITQAALSRTESRGAHFRKDFPQEHATAQHSTQHYTTSNPTDINEIQEDCLSHDTYSNANAFPYAGTRR